MFSQSLVIRFHLIKQRNSKFSLNVKVKVNLTFIALRNNSVKKVIKHNSLEAECRNKVAAKRRAVQ